MITAHNPLIDSKNRIYYLDLLRALAIMLVFTGHTVLSYGPTALTSPLQLGGTGVDLFFLLSGWLIGSQLFSEQEKFGNIELRRFWFRRWMRTFPAYFAVLLFTLTQLYLTKDHVANPLPYFTFTQNYFIPLQYFTISWSLAVEEQFYLAIAPIIIFLSKLRFVWVQFSILIILLLTPSIFRYLGLFDYPQETHVRWDCCLMGVVLAFINQRLKPLWDSLKKIALPLCLLASATYLIFYWFRWYPPFIGYTDPSKLILALVFGAMVIKAASSPVTKLPFLHVVIMHISTRSYSIYLIHVEALSICRRLIPEQSLLVYYAAALIISLTAAELLYRLIEIPFIKMRDRFALSSKRKFKNC
jgi:peptidoglycan/LPS O-acetylase OafA/YrhL